MEIKIADKAGFCFGVDRAVKIAYDTAGNATKKIYTYGMLIHNHDVTSELEEMGVCCAENIEDIPEGAAVIIRAHGISEREYREIEEKNAEICDYVVKADDFAAAAKEITEGLFGKKKRKRN